MATTLAPASKVNAGSIGAALAAAVQAVAIHKWPYLNVPEIWLPLTPIIAGVGSAIGGWFRRMTDESEWSWWPLPVGLALVAVGLASAVWVF